MNPAGLYTQVRLAEGRLFPDEVVRRLPDLPGAHPLAAEWRARAASSRRLKRYLARLGRGPLTILEVGCGNGWLSNLLAGIPGARVCGLDVGRLELAQAARLFGGQKVIFLAADIVSNAPFAAPAFDIIVLASAIQYFPDLPALLCALRPLLNPGGEIHLLDSPLYAPGELDAARQRTRTYYEGLGFPGMAAHYFHHPAAALRDFSPRWLYRPQSLSARLRRKLGGMDTPFPWVRVR